MAGGKYDNNVTSGQTPAQAAMNAARNAALKRANALNNMRPKVIISKCIQETKDYLKENGKDVAQAFKTDPVYMAVNMPILGAIAGFNTTIDMFQNAGIALSNSPLFEAGKAYIEARNKQNK